MSDYPDPFQTYNQRPISDLISTPDTSHRERALRKLPQPGEIGEDELYVMIIRPPFEELYELVLHDGQSTEVICGLVCHDCLGIPTDNFS